MHGVIMSVLVVFLIFARFYKLIDKKIKVQRLMDEKKKRLELESRTFENTDNITVGEFATVIDGRPMFSMQDYKDKVISSITKDKLTKENCVFFWEKVPETMTHEDILFMDEIDEMALFVVADKKIDLLRTYVVDDVRKAYNQMVRAYNLTESFQEASTYSVEDEDNSNTEF